MLRNSATPVGCVALGVALLIIVYALLMWLRKVRLARPSQMPMGRRGLGVLWRWPSWLAYLKVNSYLLQKTF